MPKATPAQLAAFANELSDCMAAAGASRRDLADAFAVTTQAVDLWATGQREPDPRTVQRLEEFLGAQGRLSGKLGYDLQSRRNRRFQLEPEPQPVDDGLRIAASGVDLDELRERDPEAYDLIVAQARMALDRARKRRGR